MAVAVDVTGTNTLSGTTASPHTYTGLTTGGSLSNGAVLFFVFYDQHVTGSAATWDGVACTLVASAQTTGTVGRVEIWGLSPIGAHTGAKTFSVSWSSGGSVQTEIIGLSFTGVDQTGGTTSFPNGTSASSAVTVNSSITITSAVGNIALAAHVTDTGVFDTNNATLIFVDGSPNNIAAIANRDVGAATVTLTAHVTVAGWAVAGVDVLAGSAVVAPPTVSLGSFAQIRIM